MTDESNKAKPAKPSSAGTTQEEIDIILCTRRAVEKTISTRCGFPLTEKPQISKKTVVRYMHKARIVRPPDCAFVSVITFRNPHLKRIKFEVQGMVVLYIPEDTAGMLARVMGHAGAIEEEDIMDACGEFLNVLAGHLKEELVSAGYEELELSLPYNFGHNIDELFDYEKPDTFELIFSKEGTKFICVDIGLAAMQKAGKK